MSVYTAEIVLNAKDNASGPLNKITGTVVSMEGALKSLLASAASLAATFGAGMGIAELVGRGFEFNKTMETTRTGIGAVLLATRDYYNANGQLLGGQDAVNAALGEASTVQKALVKDAETTSASVLELTGAFNNALSPATAAGVTKLDDVRKITVAATQAMAALGIPTREATQEIRGMFAGEVGPDNRLNQILRVTKDELKAVKGNADEAAELFMRKLAPFAAMAGESSQGFTTKLSNLGDTLDRVMGTATKPIFEGLKASIDATGGALPGMEGGLEEVGKQAAALLSQITPLIPPLLDLAVKALGAGAAFLSAFSPLVPLIKPVAEAISAVLGATGPLVPLIWAASSAFTSLAAEGSLAVKGLEAFVAVSNSGGIAAFVTTLGGFVVALAAVAAAAYTVKLAMDWKKENEAAQASYGGMADTMIGNLTRIGASHGELTGQVNALKAEIIKAQNEGGDAVEKNSTRFQTEFKKIAAAAKESTPPLDGMRKGIEAIPKTIGPTAAEIEKQQKALEKHRKEVERQHKAWEDQALRVDTAVLSFGNWISAHERAAGGRGLQGIAADVYGVETKYADLNDQLVKQVQTLENSTKGLQANNPEWARLQAELEGAKTRSENLRTEWGKAKVEDLKKAYVDATNAIVAQLDLTKPQRIQKEKEAVDGQIAEGLRFVENAKAKYGPTGELIALEQAFHALAIQKEGEFIDSMKIEQGKLAGDWSMVWSGMLGQLGDPTASGYAKKIRDAHKAMADLIVQEAGTGPGGMAAGVVAAWHAISGSVQTEAESWAGFAKGAWDAITGSVQSGLLDVMNGNLTGLTDLFSGAFNTIKSNFASMLSNMVQGWLTGQQTIGSGIASLSKAVSGDGSLLGFATSGATGLGVGSLVGGFSGAPGFSTGATIGGGVAAAGIAAAAAGVFGGAAAGAVAGSVVPILGTIIGAIVGGLIGVLSSKNTEQKVDVLGTDALASGRSNDAIGDSILRTRDSLFSGTMDLFRAAGYSNGKMAGQAGWVNGILGNTVSSMTYNVHAGSSEDLQKDMDRLLGTEIPKLMLRRLFGQTETGAFPELPGIKGIPGFEAGSWDKGAPIPAMLDGLGFTAEKITYIAGLIDKRAPEEVMKYLNTMVGLVVGFDDLSKNFAKSGDQLRAEIADSQKRTVVDTFKAGADNILQLASELTMYSGDEQVSRAQQLLQLSEQRYQAELQALAELDALAKSISASVANQLESMQKDMVPDAQLGNYYQGIIEQAMAELANASDADTIKALTAKIQNSVAGIWGWAGQKNGQNQELYDWLQSILKQMETLSNDRLKKIGDDIVATNAGLDEAMTKAKNVFTTLGDTTLPDVKDSAEGASEGMDKVATAALRLEKVFGSLADAAAAAAAFAGSGGGGDLASARANPRLLVSRTA